MATDNIDVRLRHAMRLFLDNSHELRMTATQQVEPVKSTPRLDRRPDPLVHFDALKKLPQKSIAEDFVRPLSSDVLKDWKNVAVGSISLNADALLGESEPRSFAHIIQNHLIGDKKDPARILRVELSGEPANAPGAMENVANMIKRRARVGEDVDCVVLAADQPLFTKLVNLVRRGPGGANPHYSWLMPIPGQFHNAMSMQNAAKRLFSDAILKALATRSGLSEKRIENLQNFTHFTIMHRFLTQAHAAITLHVKDKLRASGDAAGYVSARDEELLAEGEELMREAKLGLADSADTRRALAEGARLQKGLE